MGGLQRSRKNNKESGQPDNKQETPRAAAENSGKRPTIPHNTAPSLCIVAEEEKKKQLV
jgi:hypothetical protein